VRVSSYDVRSENPTRNEFREAATGAGDMCRERPLTFFPDFSPSSYKEVSPATDSLIMIVPYPANGLNFATTESKYFSTDSLCSSGASQSSR